MTRLPWMLVGVALLAQAACGGRQVDSTIQVVSVQGAALGNVVLAVPGERVQGEPRCDDRVSALGTENGTLLSLVWGSDEARSRRVTVQFDEDGLPMTYSDMRGGLGNIRTHGQPTPGTVIMLNWPEESALVQNQDREGTSSTIRVDFDEALESETLGRPSELVQRMREMCSKAGEAADSP